MTIKHEPPKPFDADLYIELRDRTGMVAVLTVAHGKTGILSWLGEHDSAETQMIYKDHRAVFDAYSDGGSQTREMLAAALRKAGRVMVLDDDGWRPDPNMPAHVRAVHFP